MQNHLTSLSSLNMRKIYKCRCTRTICSLNSRTLTPGGTKIPLPCCSAVFVFVIFVSYSMYSCVCVNYDLLNDKSYKFVIVFFAICSTCLHNLFLCSGVTGFILLAGGVTSFNHLSHYTVVYQSASRNCKTTNVFVRAVQYVCIKK